jgi:hypothetical protein
MRVRFGRRKLLWHHVRLRDIGLHEHGVRVRFLNGVLQTIRPGDIRHTQPQPQERQSRLYNADARHVQRDDDAPTNWHRYSDWGDDGLLHVTMNLME